eukprot:6343198-Karenia_brevis.AAC.1
MEVAKAVPKRASTHTAPAQQTSTGDAQGKAAKQSAPVTAGVRIQKKSSMVPASTIHNAIPGYQGQMKAINIPSTVPEDVLAAAIKASMAAHTLSINGTTVSAPA